ncbi:hypothetical protein JOM56_007078 [Amanita muscaria]
MQRGEDKGFFGEEEEDAGASNVPARHHIETYATNSGDFAGILDKDYLRLRELGIAEFGMASLTIPTKLLRNEKTQKTSGNASKPNEPPPFLPLTPLNKLDYSSRTIKLGSQSAHRLLLRMPLQNLLFLRLPQGYNPQESPCNMAPKLHRVVDILKRPVESLELMGAVQSDAIACTTCQ